MSPHSLDARIVYALALASLMTAPAVAQTTRASGPFAGLFGGGQNSDHTLDLRGSIFGAYDFGRPLNVDRRNQVHPDNASDPVLVDSGGLRGINAEIDYAHQGTRTQFGVRGSGAFEQYPASELGGATYSAQSDFTANVTRRLAVESRGAYARSAFYRFAPSITSDPIGSVPLRPGYDGAALAQPNTTVEGALSLTTKFSRYSSVAGGVRSTTTRFLGAGSDANSQQWGANVYFDHRIKRSLSLQLGYDRGEFRGGPSSSPVVMESINLAVNYAGDLSLTRKMKVSLHAEPGVSRFDRRTNFRLDGGARLALPFLQSWLTEIGYSHETVVIPGFSKPLFLNAVEGSIGGLIRPRVEWSGTAGFSQGHIGLDESASFGVYTATSALQFAVARHLGLFGQYSHYWSRVPLGSTDLSLLPIFSRHAVTAGLTAWVPLLNRRLSRGSR